MFLFYYSANLRLTKYYLKLQLYLFITHSVKNCFVVYNKYLLLKIKSTNCFLLIMSSSASGALVSTSSEDAAVLHYVIRKFRRPFADINFLQRVTFKLHTANFIKSQIHITTHYKNIYPLLLYMIISR